VRRGTIAITYDGEGNRVAKSVAGVTTKYLVDTNNLTGYAQVFEELQSGSVVRKYTYGLDLISQLNTQNSQLSFYGYDGHGSVRQLTNTAGAVTDTYTYDAFGNLLERTGTTPNLYLYAGEQFDPDLGLYYNRARYLDVRNGRFWGMDDYEGDLQSPPYLHKYLYTMNNPSLLDPSGYETVAESLTSAAINTTLQTLAFSVPFRAIQFAYNVAAGENLAEAAQNAALDVVKDVGLGLLTLGLFRFARTFAAVRAAGQTISRLSTSLWNLAPFARGRALEQLILDATKRLHPNFPVIDSFAEGVAVSLKSLDLTAATYQSTTALVSKLGQYAAQLGAFQGARFAGQRVVANEIKERVLVVALEEGAATLEQAVALRAFIVDMAKQWPNVKIVFQFVP
jgi:RHS repeat-associated protein